MTSRCGFDPIRETDVLVIGAGPAGCMAAREAARKGAQVLLVERKKKVGTPVRCGEYVPRRIGDSASRQGLASSQSWTWARRIP